MKIDTLRMMPIAVWTSSYFWLAISGCITTYTGTCIILSVLAIVFRFLVAFRSVLEKHRTNIDIKSQAFIYMRKPTVDTRISRVLLIRGGKADGVSKRRHTDRMRSWRRTFDGPRAAIDSLIVSTFYFL